VVILLQGGAAAAQNFLANSTFDANVNGWPVEDPPDASVAWDGTLGSPGPGSARISNISAGPSNGAGVSQCGGAVTAGKLYNWGGRVYLPSGQGRSGPLEIGLRWYNTPGCTGSVVDNQPRMIATIFDTWVPLSKTNEQAPAGAVSVQFVAFPSKVEAGGVLVGNFDTLFFGQADGLIPPCAADATTLCLNGGRFSVTAAWRSPAASGPGFAVPLTSDTGAFWFFSSNNLEGMFKLVTGCAFNNFYWFFAGGLTNVKVTIRVTDTTTGIVRIYENPLNVAFQPIQDTAAFPCP
jgi:hypothetical protein